MWKKDQGKWSVRGATLVTGEEEEMWMKRVRRGKELGCRLTDKGPVYNSQGVNSPIHTAVWMRGSYANPPPALILLWR